MNHFIHVIPIGSWWYVIRNEFKFKYILDEKPKDYQSFTLAKSITSLYITGEINNQHFISEIFFSIVEGIFCCSNPYMDISQ